MNKVIELLKESGAVLTRHKKHQVWRLPNGQNFVIAQSTSDRRSERNNLSDLRKMLGITNEKNGEPKPKEYRPRHEKQDLPYFGKSVNRLGEKLPVELIDNSLKEKLADAERQNQVLRELLDDVLAENEYLAKSSEAANLEIERLQQGFWYRIRNFARRWVNQVKAIRRVFTP